MKNFKFRAVLFVSLAGLFSYLILGNCVQNFLQCPQDVLTLRTECSEEVAKEEQSELNLLAALGLASSSGGGSGGESGSSENGGGEPGGGGSGGTGSAVSAPDFYPAAGTYFETQVISLSNGTATALICYTTNGIDPDCDTTPACSVGTEFSTDFNVSSTTTIKAIACRNGFTSSGIESRVFTIQVPSPGDAIWARSTTTSPAYNVYYGVRVDGTGKIHAAGGQVGTGTYRYGPGSSWGTPRSISTGPHASALNPVRLQFTINGRAIEGNHASGGTLAGPFRSVAIDNSENVFTVGFQEGTGLYSYTGSGSVAGSAAGNNATVLKFGSPGWAKTVSAGNSSSEFKAVAVNNFGQVYAAGVQSGTGTNSYGTGASVAGIYSGINALLVKFDSNGAGLWARSVSTGLYHSAFNSVAVDSSGNIYAGGQQFLNSAYTYGPGVSATGAGGGGNNSVLVKYNLSGTALWAKSITAGYWSTQFNSIAVDNSGNVYAAGLQYGTGSYSYGPGVSVAGLGSGDNAVLVKYNSSGTAQWARVATAGGWGSEFNSVAVDGSGDVYVAGYQNGTINYTYGPGVNVAGVSLENNALLVKYNSSGTARWARSVTAGSNKSLFYAVTVTGSSVITAGSQYGNGSFTYGPGVSVAGASASPGSSAVLVKYAQ